MSVRILHVIATLDRGGTEVTALEIARELAGRGVESLVASLDVGHSGIAGDFAAIAGVPTILPAGRLRRAYAMYRLVAARRPDAVLFHFYNIEHVVLGAAARLAGVRRITVKLGNPVGAGAVMARKMRIIARLTDFLGIKVVTASHWIERSLVESGRAPTDRRVIYNGCNTEVIWARADKIRAERRRDEAIVGMVSRLDRIKDHKTLLAAFAKLPAAIQGRRTQLVFVGDGELRLPLETEARELGIADRVTFAGARSDIPECLAGFDVFAFSTTRDEGFGVVLIEALAAGTPIVASDVPACHEVLEGGHLGRIVPPADPDALARALHEMLADPPNVPTRSEITRRYGVSAMVDKHYETLFPQSETPITGLATGGSAAGSSNTTNTRGA